MRPRTKLSKEKQMILKMLEMYKNMPFLWDKNHEHHNLGNRRCDGYRILLDIYKQIDPNATFKTLTKKIHYLRTNYIREYKKVEYLKSTGVGDTYVPTLWYYDAFSFLKCGTEPDPEPCPSVMDTPQEEHLPLPTEDLPLSSPSDTDSRLLIASETPVTPQKKRKKITEGCLRKRKVSTSDSDEKPLSKNDEWLVTGKAIGIQLRDLNKRQLVIAQKIISDTIFYAKTGKLTEDSYIVLRQNTQPDDSSHSPYRFRGQDHPDQIYAAVKKSPHSNISSPAFCIDYESPSPHSSV